MPKLLFYAGTAFCVFVALTSAAEAVRELQGGAFAFVALPPSPRSPWAVAVALVAGLAVAAMFLRMAALLAARNLFGALMAALNVGGAVVSLAAVLLLQWRIVGLLEKGIDSLPLSEIHLAACLLLGFFVSLSMLSLRPYFSIQASRFLSGLVFVPAATYALVIAQELFSAASSAPLPARSPASLLYFGVVALLFACIAVHCIRHRHLFLEMTNLRELMEGRIDPFAPRPRRTIGGVAFDT